MTALKQIATKPKLNLKTFDPELFNDREIMEALIRKSHFNIAYIGERLNNDLDLFLLAFELKEHSYCQLGNILAYAGKELRSCKEKILKFIPYERYLYGYITDDLRSDKEFVKVLIKDSVEKKPNGQNIDYRMLPLELMDDEEIVEGVVASYTIGFSYSNRDAQNPELADQVKVYNKNRDNADLMLRILTKNGFALQSATDRIKDSEEHVLAAVGNCAACIEYASSRLKSSEVFRKKCFDIIPEGRRDQYLRYCN